tara:strand:+ start:286 stop:594 length:309 start_codon:yes stop_codon:yes gene_type:complete
MGQTLRVHRGIICPSFSQRLAAFFVHKIILGGQKMSLSNINSDTSLNGHNYYKQGDFIALSNYGMLQDNDYSELLDNLIENFIDLPFDNIFKFKKKPFILED